MESLQEVKIQLTSDQQEMVVANEGLVRYFMKKYSRPIGMDWGDWEQEVWFCLIRAVGWHNPAKGTLSTLMSRLVWNTHSTMLKAAKRRNAFVRLDGGGDDADLAGQIVDPFVDNSTDDKDECRSILLSLEPRKRTILIMYSQGNTLEQIGKKLGVSKQAIKQNIETVKAKYGVDSEFRVCNICGSFSRLYRARCLRCRAVCNMQHTENFLKKRKLRRSKACKKPK